MKLARKLTIRLSLVLVSILAVIVAIQFWSLRKSNAQTDDQTTESDGWIDLNGSGDESSQGTSERGAEPDLVTPLLPREPQNGNPIEPFSMSPTDLWQWHQQQIDRLFGGWFNQPFGREPMEQMMQMQQQMEQIMRGTLGLLEPQDFVSSQATPDFQATVHVEEQPWQYVVRVHVPEGYEHAVVVDLSGSSVEISADFESQVEDQAQDGIVHRSVERRHFSQVIPLPGPVYGEGMTTNVQPGLIEIAVPKEGMSL